MASAGVDVFFRISFLFVMVRLPRVGEDSSSTPPIVIKMVVVDKEIGYKERGA